MRYTLEGIVQARLILIPIPIPIPILIPMC